MSEVNVSSAFESGNLVFRDKGGNAILTLDGANGAALSAYKSVAEVVTTTNEITAAETGSVFFLNNATGFVSTLPAAALGLRYTFIVTTAVTTTAGHTIVCPAAATLFKGIVLTNDVNSGTDADFGTSGEATVTFVINKTVAGDRVDVVCDGTNWFVQASCSVFDAITIT